MYKLFNKVCCSIDELNETLNLKKSWQRGLVQNPAFNKLFRKLYEK